MAWIKHQKQTINGTEYEYWYVYKTYYEPGMDHPHQVKLGKVGESASELANCLREKGKDKGWDVSEEEIQELEDTVEEAQEMAEDDEDIAEQIEKMSGETVDTEEQEEEEDDSEEEMTEREKMKLDNPVNMSDELPEEYKKFETHMSTDSERVYKWKRGKLSSNVNIGTYSSDSVDEEGNKDLDDGKRVTVGYTVSEMGKDDEGESYSSEPYMTENFDEAWNKAQELMDGAIEDYSEAPDYEEDKYEAKVGDKIRVVGTPPGEFASRSGEWVVIKKMEKDGKPFFKLGKSGKRKEVLAGGANNRGNRKNIYKSELEKQINDTDPRFDGSDSSRNYVELVEREVESDRVHYDDEDSSVKSRNDFSEKVEDNIEQIDRKVGDVLSNYDDWSMSRDGDTFTVEGNGAELKIEVREDYYALYGSDLEEMVSDIGFRGIHDVKKDGDKYLRKYGSNHDVQDFVRYHGEGESIDAGSAGVMSDRIENNNLDKVSTESLKGFYEEFTEGDRQEYTDTLAYALVINPDWAGEKVDDDKLEWMEERRKGMSEDLVNVKIELERRGVEVEDYKEFKEPLPEKGQVIRWEDNEVYTEDPEESEDDDFDNMQAVKKLTRKGVIVQKDAVDEIRPGDVERIESLDTTPMYLSASMLRSLRDHKGDISGSKTVDIDTGDLEYANVEIISDVPEFMGMDGDVYGEYDGGEQITLPDDNAEILVNRGLAERVEEEEDSSVKNDDSSDDQDKGDDSMDTDDGYVKVEFLQKTPQFMGTDLEQYGGFEKGDVAEIPEDNAEILENRGNVEVKGGVANVAEKHNQSSRDKNGSDSSSERDISENVEGLPEGFERLMTKVREWIEENETEDEGAVIEDLTSRPEGIMAWAEMNGWSEDQVMEAMDRLKARGELFEPRQGRIKTI